MKFKSFLYFTQKSKTQKETQDAKRMELVEMEIKQSNISMVMMLSASY